MDFILGVDLACRAAHVASLARTDGTFVWTARKFATRSTDLDRLWADLDLQPEDSLLVVLEPTRNAWVPVAAWFRRRGATVVLVPTTQSADLRAYYTKHTKNDRLDSRLLARLPLLHPEGLRRHTSDGPAEPLRRAVKVRATLVKRRTAVFARLDAHLELLGPSWYDALGSRYGKAALAVLARYADPTALLRLGQARLSRFLIAHSHGGWRDQHARELLAAARESVQLWQGGLDFAQLAADIALEAEQAQALTRQIEDLDTRIARLHAAADPAGVLASVPGVGPVTASTIVGRLGDPHRFTSLAAIRGYSGMVPRVHESGLSAGPGRLTKAGDPLLREALFQAADNARKIDPQLAARYVRLIASGRHHDSAVRHLATILLTRIAACWRAGQHYTLRDTDGRQITTEEGRRIVANHHQLPPIATKRARSTPPLRPAHMSSRRAAADPPNALTSPPTRPAPELAPVCLTSLRNSPQRAHPHQCKRAGVAGPTPHSHQPVHESRRDRAPHTSCIPGGTYAKRRVDDLANEARHRPPVSRGPTSECTAGT